MVRIDSLVEKFGKYYYKYLGCDNKINFLCSKNDDFKVNEFIYPMIYYN